MYRSEQQFSQALLSKLSKKPLIVQRIESAVTGAGIPDIYLRARSGEMWLELKNDKYSSIAQSEWTVNWRKGQQAWAFMYYRVTGSLCYTAVSLKDGFLWIPMVKRFIHNIVTVKDCIVCKSLDDIVRKIA